MWLMLLLGLWAQWFLMDLAWQLYEVCVRVFELWAELARLHLDVVAK